MELALVNISNSLRWLRCDTIDVSTANRTQAYELALVHAPDAAREVFANVLVLPTPVRLAVLKLALVLAPIVQLDRTVTLWNPILGQSPGMRDAAVNVADEQGDVVGDLLSLI